MSHLHWLVSQTNRRINPSSEGSPSPRRRTFSLARSRSLSLHNPGLHSKMTDLTRRVRLRKRIRCLPMRTVHPHTHLGRMRTKPEEAQIFERQKNIRCVCSSPRIDDAHVSSEELRGLADLMKQDPFRWRPKMRENRRRVDGDHRAVPHGAVVSIGTKLRRVREKSRNQTPNQERSPADAAATRTRAANNQCLFKSSFFRGLEWV